MRRGVITQVEPDATRRPEATTEGFVVPTNVLEVGGVSLYVLHDLSQLELKPEAAGFTAVVCGHSHKPKQEMRNGVLYFNPGSAGPRRFRLPVTIGRIFVSHNLMHGEILNLLVSR